MAALAFASASALLLLGLRFALSGGTHYRNLVWNLVLAWVPFALALVAYDRHRRDVGGIALALPLALWLAFLPNAPYLVTEFKLLREVHDMPIWFDVALVTSFAWVGLVLGFVSVYLVQEIARRRAGQRAGWACAVGSFAACGIGIYLGWYVRWNSWDLFLRPAGVLSDVLHALDSPRVVGMTLLMTAFLTMAYVMLYTVVRAAAEESAER